MKKILAVITTMSILSLSSFTIANTTTESNPTTTAAPITVTLQLKQEDKRLYAYINVKQAQAADGNINVVWNPPANTICTKSTYSLEYKNTSYNTRAYRTVIFDSANGNTIICSGEWNVTITDNTGSTVANGSFTVKDEATAPTINQ